MTIGSGSGSGSGSDSSSVSSSGDASGSFSGGDDDDGCSAAEVQMLWDAEDEVMAADGRHWTRLFPTTPVADTPEAVETAAAGSARSSPGASLPRVATPGRASQAGAGGGNDSPPRPCAPTPQTSVFSLLPDPGPKNVVLHSFLAFRAGCTLSYGNTQTEA
jgi:hypothetical protein